MLKYTWVLIYGVFYTAAAAITFGKLNGKDKSVNLALETVFEFGDDDKKGDVNILNSVQKFIGKVKNVIENTNGGRRQLTDDNKRFTSFIIDVIRILKQYDDEDLEQVAHIVGDELKKHHRKGSKFRILTKSLNIKDMVGKMLSEIKKKSAADIRDYLENIADKFDDKKYLKHEKRFLEAINSVYKADSTIKLNTFLTDLDDYRVKARKNMDLTKIINQGLNTVFFDHYDKLHSNLRSSFLSDLDNIFNNMFTGFDKITPKDIININRKPVTTNTLRTSRQMYVEKGLDMKYIQSAFDKWISEGVKKEKTGDKKANTRPGISHGGNKDKTQGISRGKSSHSRRTPMTKRLHDVPTTRKAHKSKNEALRSYGHHRFSKVTNEQSSPRYKKRTTGTTKRYRTYRQMYVEKNIDLKYNADAYENLTTASKIRTTRKHVKNTYKDEKDSYERHSDKEDIKPQYAKEHGTDQEAEELGQNNKKGKVIESVLSDFMIELSTEVHAPAITKSPEIRVTKMDSFSEEKSVEKDDDAEDSPLLRSNRKGLAYSSPTFLIDWSTKKPQIVKRILPRGSIEDRELHRHKAEEKRKDMDYSIEKYNIDKDLDRARRNKQNYRNVGEHHRKDYTRSVRGNLGKITKRYHGNVPVLRQEKESLSGKLKMSRDPLILAKHYGGSYRFGKNNYRRANFQAPTISEEGLSIQADDTNNKRIERRNDNTDTASKIDGDKEFLKRLQKLENELEIVKTQIKNDTNAVKDLIQNSRNEKNETITQLQKAITELKSKPNLDIEAVKQLKSINAGGFNMDIPEIYNKHTHDINKQTVDLTKTKEVLGTKYDSYRTKEDYIPNVNKEGLGRKAFDDIKKIEEVKSDDIKTYDKTLNIEATSNAPIKNIETMSVTSKMNEATLNNSKKYGEEKAIYLKVDDDSDENNFNETAYQTLKDKYGSTVNENHNDTKVFNKQEEKQLNEDIQTKSTITKADLRDHVANIPKSNSTELKRDEKPDLNRVPFVFRANDVSVNATQVDLTTKADELSKLNGGNIVPSVNIVTVTPVNNLTTVIAPGTNKLPGHLVNQLIKEIGGHLAALPDTNAGKVVQGNMGKEATDVNVLLNTIKGDGVKNDTLAIQQNDLDPNIQRPANTPITF